MKYSSLFMTLSIPPCHPIYDDIKERFRQLIIIIFYNLFDCSNLYHIFFSRNYHPALFYLFMGERRELNPRMVDPQSTALIHLATSALSIIFFNFCLERSNDPRDLNKVSEVIVFSESLPLSQIT
jgi:hypothetical protein